MPLTWTSESLSKKTTEEIRTLRENALRKAASNIVALCDAELEKRKPPPKPKADKTRVSRSGQYVSEFHFVCPNESEVSTEQSGFMRTGTWVVDEAHAEAAVKYGSLIALHVAKAEPSYLQGKIKSWRRQARQPRNAEGQLVSNTEGIEFEFEPTNEPLVWKGESSGEKGYAWSAIP